MPFRPLYVSPSWPVESACNGVVPYVHHLATELANRGHQPLVVTCRLDRNAVDQCGLEVHELTDRLWHRWTDRARLRLRMPPDVDCLISRRLIDLVARMQPGSRPDLIEIEEAFGTASSLVTRLPIPIVVRLHGPWFLNGSQNGYQNEVGYQRRLDKEGAAIRAAALVTAPSRFMLEATRDFYQLDLPRAVAIPNAVPGVPASKRWRPVRSEQPVVLFVGRFDAIKGGDVVLKGFEQVVATFPEATMVFIGPDHGVTTAEGNRQQLAEFLATELTPTAARRVLALGRQDRAAIESWQDRAAVCVIPSRFDNFPTTVLEAAAKGLPIVTTTTGGIPEIIEHGRTGLLVEPGNVEQLSAAICQVLSDGGLAARLGSAAAADAEARFSPTVVATQMLEIYSPLLKQQRVCA